MADSGQKRWPGGLFGATKEAILIWWWVVLIFYVHPQINTFQKFWSLVWLKSFPTSCSRYYTLRCYRVSHTVPGAQPTPMWGRVIRKFNSLSSFLLSSLRRGFIENNLKIHCCSMLLLFIGGFAFFFDGKNQSINWIVNNEHRKTNAVITITASLLRRWGERVIISFAFLYELKNIWLLDQL